ncbi:MAG: V-type ATPase subunit [Synergistaceae bacterium]|nr:V-type ATPase subunit [Synergistaceae bacterium]
MPLTAQYGYAVARLRAMSGNLVEDSVLQRILESEDLEGAFKVLGETVYSAWLVELKGSGDFDHVIESELVSVYDEVQRFVPDVRLVQLFRLPYDFHNVKVLLKSVILLREGGERRFDLLTPLGNIPSDDLIMAMESEDFRLLSFGLHTIIPTAFALWEQTRDILEVEKILDSGLFAAMKKLAVESGIEQALLWVRGKIDGENIRNLLRLKRMDTDASAAAGFLHEGGFLSKERLLSLLSEPVESWPRAIAFTDVARAFSEVQDVTDLSALLVEMERIIDDYVASILEKAKYKAFAPENILAFLWRKELEAKNIRIALVSVASNTDRTFAKGLFRHAG